VPATREFVCKRCRVPICRTVICREQMSSAQGCFERVLQMGARYLVWHCFKSRAWPAPVLIIAGERVLCLLPHSASGPTLRNGFTPGVKTDRIRAVGEQVAK
jgi:hypothetical protein